MPGALAPSTTACSKGEPSRSGEATRMTGSGKSAASAGPLAAIAISRTAPNDPRGDNTRFIEVSAKSPFTSTEWKQAVSAGCHILSARLRMKRDQREPGARHRLRAARTRFSSKRTNVPATSSAIERHDRSEERRVGKKERRQD